MVGSDTKRIVKTTKIEIMKFFKEIEQEFHLLTKDALEQLWENLRGNAKGTKSGVTRTALREAGHSKEKINQKIRGKSV